VHIPLVHSAPVTVDANMAKNLPLTATDGLVDMRGHTAVVAGTYVFDGPNLVTGWHAHDLHQLEYAFAGTIEVETEAAHYLLPAHQAAWIPAGLSHNSILKGVRTISVFFVPDLVPDEGARARILAAAPVIREMILYGVRWPISRPRSDRAADSFFTALAALVLEWLEHETPLCLPTTQDPLIRAVMDHTNANLATVTAGEVCGTVGVSERSLRRAFPAATGMTWHQYLFESRLLRAMTLLAEPGRTILDVANDVGFTGSSFARAFARHTGETPSAYRRRVAGDRR
jgi:AraC-like DNA-binding protein/quercetin dioxygenase-like cupin family protein